MEEIKPNSIKELLNITNSKIQAFNEFKTAYNNQIAFDFNILNFFSVGENKVSEILAFFLNEKEKHGQGNIFLEIFIKEFFKENVEIDNASIKCEKIISKKRRIDIIIELPQMVIAIENKLWALDQNNQLTDYSNYLNRYSNGNYRLFYLNPYGNEPSSNSIDKKLIEELTKEEKFQILSYKDNILEIIDKWINACEAENVSYFLKQFKQYLKNKFLGKKTLNMSTNLKELIFEKREEVEVLIGAYKEIEDKLTRTLDAVGKELQSDNYKLTNPELKLKKEGPFNYIGKRVYKYGISSNSTILWVQIIRENIDLKFNYYIQENDEIEFRSYVDQSELENEILLDKDITKQEIITEFLKRVQIAEILVQNYNSN